jgi:rhodanese-related sulfurtransferase
MRKLLIVLASTVLAATALTSCSSGASTKVDPAEAKTLIEGGAGIIDVRTPQEYAEGHLSGALNIDVTAPDFADRVGELAKDVTYVVYCRSGNRSASAVDQMSDLGFTDLNDAGGFADLANAGIPWE